MATPTGVITQAGQTGFLLLLKDETEEPFIYVGFGIGTTAATVYDIALENEVAREEATLSKSGNAILINGQHTATVGNNISEFGIFNADNVMLYRGVLASADAVGVDDIDVFELKLNVAQGTY